jgi:hypothetical protein
LGLYVADELAAIETKCCSDIECRKITAVCSEIHKNTHTHIYILCGLNMELFKVTIYWWFI